MKFSEDKAFTQLATETYDYLLFVSNNLKQVKLTQSEIQNNLAKIQAQTLNYEEQMKSIDLLFKNSFSIRSLFQCFQLSKSLLNQ